MRPPERARDAPRAEAPDVANVATVATSGTGVVMLPHRSTFGREVAGVRGLAGLELAVALGLVPVDLAGVLGRAR